MFDLLIVCLIVELNSIIFVSHQYSVFTYSWWTICFVVVTRIVLPYRLVFFHMRIEDDIEWDDDDDDDDAEAITVMTALTVSCIVMKEHICKKRQRQKKKKGGCPFTISR